MSWTVSRMVDKFRFRNMFPHFQSQRRPALLFRTLSQPKTLWQGESGEKWRVLALTLQLKLATVFLKISAPPQPSRRRENEVVGWQMDKLSLLHAFLLASPRSTQPLEMASFRARPQPLIKRSWHYRMSNIILHKRNYTTRGNFRKWEQSVSKWSTKIKRNFQKRKSACACSQLGCNPFMSSVFTRPILPHGPSL